jgi:hypothetical protein
MTPEQAVKSLGAASITDASGRFSFACRKALVGIKMCSVNVPQTAKKYSRAKDTSYDRCVRSRWQPILMPRPAPILFGFSTAGLLSAIRTQQWGSLGDLSIVADFDRDGHADYAVWRPSNGMWWMMPSSNPIRTQQWGLPGDIPLPGDFNGDEKADYAVWRASTGTWWVMPSSNPSSHVETQWGLPLDVPL